MQATNKKKLRHYLYKAVLFINALTLFLMFISAFAWKVPPSKTTLFAYLGLGFSLILVANIVFFLFWVLLRKWKYAIISLMPILIAMNPILTFFPIHFQSDEIPEGCIKVLSYNVRAFNWFEGNAVEDSPTIQYIKDSNADIVCIQEFLSINDDKKRNISRIRKALTHYPYYSFTRLESNKKTVHKRYQYGLACFSKYPILSTTQIPIKTRDNAGSSLMQIRIKDKTITVINNHLESNRLTSEDRELYRDFLRDISDKTIDVANQLKTRLGSAYDKRGPQAELIDAWIKKQKTDGVIVCGDFNDTPISYTYYKIKGDLTDSYAATGFGTGITYHENNFWFRIDFIMHSDNIESYNCMVDNSIKESDHYPVSTYLKIN